MSAGKKPLYFIINKPFKVLSQFSDEGKNKGLGSIFKLPKDVYPVGRLDLDSEGLLILTNDKKLNHRLLDPKFAHMRTYHVEVEGVPDETSIARLSEGVTINLKGKKHHTAPAKVRLLGDYQVEERNPPVNRIKHPETSWLSMGLKEGKNRQVRRMTAGVGHPTLRLIRVSIESLDLGDMKPGDIVQVSQKVIYKKLNLSV